MVLGTITLDQEPVEAADKIPVMTNANPVIGYMVKQSDIEDLFYFKLILEVRITDGSGELIGKIKQRRNGYSVDVANDAARAYFDLRDLVNTVLIDTVWDQNMDGQPFLPIHTLGANDTDLPFSQNGDHKLGKTQISAIYVKAYQEYSESADASPEEDDDETVNDTLYWLQATVPLFTKRNVDAEFLQSEYFQKYSLDAPTKEFLSDVQESVAEYNLGAVRRNYVQESDYHTIAFLNGETDFNSKPRYIKVAYYTAAGVQIGSTQQLSNRITSGGAIPQSVGTEVDRDSRRLIYCGVGPENLEAQVQNEDAQPSEFPDWAYYKIWAYYGTDMSTPYYFIKQDGSCKGFKVRRLGWRNSVGGYDYFNFKMKSTQTLEIKRNNYNTLLGRFDGSKYSYNDIGRGITTRKTLATLKETLQTDWITEEDAILLEKLIYSTSVYVIQNADTEFTVGVVITDKSFVIKTVSNNKMIQYTIRIEYANPINTNS